MTTTVSSSANGGSHEDTKLESTKRSENCVCVVVWRYSKLVFNRYLIALGCIEVGSSWTAHTHARAHTSRPISGHLQRPIYTPTHIDLSAARIRPSSYALVSMGVVSLQQSYIYECRILLDIDHTQIAYVATSHPPVPCSRARTKSRRRTGRPPKSCVRTEVNWQKAVFRLSG